MTIKTTTIISYETCTKLAIEKSHEKQEKILQDQEEYLLFLTTRTLEFIGDKIDKEISNGYTPPYMFRAQLLRHTPVYGKRSSLQHRVGWRIPSGKGSYYPTYKEVYAVLPNVNKTLKEKGWKVSTKLFSQEFKITSV